MPIPPLLTAALETLGNHFLALDEESAVRRSMIAGQVLSVELSPLPRLFFVLSEQQLDVLAQYEGEVDCRLQLSLWTLVELSQADKIPQLIKQDKLQLSGDIQLAQQFANLFLQCRPDIEEKLSAVVGDALAYRCCTLLRQLSLCLSERWQQCPQRLHDLAAEEWRLLVVNEEYQHWQQQVHQLALSLAALELRVEALSQDD